MLEPASTHSLFDLNILYLTLYMVIQIEIRFRMEAYSLFDNEVFLERTGIAVILILV